MDVKLKREKEKMDANKKLQQACIRGDFEAIEAALSEGANINAIVDGYSILSSAQIMHRSMELLVIPSQQCVRDGHILKIIMDYFEDINTVVILLDII